MSQQPHNLLIDMMQYVHQHRMMHIGSATLAGVSGGIDSMVMLRLLHRAGIRIVVAHCNFGLRGEESDDDENFVRAEAQNLGIPFRTVRFDTEAYAAKNQISIQMAARELRYRWFYEQADRENCKTIAIAHNRDDRIETLFINMARGTGVRGLAGIKPVNGRIIRPLLFASRADIETCAHANSIHFREDASNATVKYARNYIRHEVLPGMERYFPGMRQAVERSIEHFADVELIYREAIDQYRRQIVSEADGATTINLPALMQTPAPHAILFELLLPFGFPKNTATDILNDDTQRSGRLFTGSGYYLVCNRMTLIIQPVRSDFCDEYLIGEHTHRMDTPVRMNILRFAKPDGYVPDNDPNVACLDADKIEYPLRLRRWEHGDAFYPLGMKQKKKLQDFFTDAKLSLIDKYRHRILLSGDRIAWVAGLRIDNRFKITAKTTRIIRLQLEGFCS